MDINGNMKILHRVYIKIIQRRNRVMNKKGSSIAEEIVSEIKRAEYFKEYAKRKKKLKEKLDKINIEKGENDG